MDGGSTDGSVDIIKKYEKYLAYWQSQPDKGQTHAIIDGFNRAKGEVLAWLNSDDAYEPGVLKKVQSYFFEHPETEFLYGNYFLLYPDGRKIAKPKISFDFNICLYAYLMIPQPSSFWTRNLYNAVGGLNPEFQYAFDYDFFLRAGKYLQERPGAIVHINDYWSRFRVHDTSKSVSEREKFRYEHKKIHQQFEVSPLKFVRKFRQQYELLRAIYRYHKEEGMIPTRKEKGKA